MLRVFVRRSRDASYLADDPARELDGVRDGDAQWWVRGAPAENVGDVFTSTPRSGVVGYDLIVAAPRPISILLALDPESAGGVVAAHRASVAAAISYLDERAVVVRERLGGDDLEVPARFSRVAGFTHGLNRHGEPHLHDHVLVGARPAGEGRVLDARSLYAHAPAADALYRSSLRYEVAQRTPWRPWRSFRGVEMVAGLDEGYRALWGGHHADRGEKLYWTREDAVERWGDDLRALRARGRRRGAPGAPLTRRARLRRGARGQRRAEASPPRRRLGERGGVRDAGRGPELVARRALPAAARRARAARRLARPARGAHDRLRARARAAAPRARRAGRLASPLARARASRWSAPGRGGTARHGGRG